MDTTLGTDIDAAVGRLLVDSVTPIALDLALAVQQEIAARLEETDRLRHRQVERAQYEADAARHRYMHVDPANRLVADSLEADWNRTLRALADANEDYQRRRAADRLTVDEPARQRILALATDFPAVWRDPHTPHRERKRMLALMIDDVTLVKQREITAAVRFRGGAATTLTLPRPLTAQQIRATHEDVRREIDALLDEYTDAQVANLLNERGLRTGAGDAFDPVSVQWVCFSHKLTNLKERLLAAGWRTTKQITATLGVGRTTLGRWRAEGRIKGRICNDRGEWLYWPPERVLDEKAGDAIMSVTTGTSDNLRGRCSMKIIPLGSTCSTARAVGAGFGCSHGSSTRPPWNAFSGIWAFRPTSRSPSPLAPRHAMSLIPTARGARRPMRRADRLGRRVPRRCRSSPSRAICSCLPSFDLASSGPATR